MVTANAVDPMALSDENEHVATCPAESVNVVGVQVTEITGTSSSTTVIVEVACAPLEQVAAQFSATTALTLPSPATVFAVPTTVHVAVVAPTGTVMLVAPTQVPE
jgi:hypothetical protein